jgi:topoisomerase-4 subunit A
MSEEIIAAFPYKEIDANKLFIFMSKEGMIKQTRMSEFSPWRTYRSRPTAAMKMKNDSDQIVSVFLTSDVRNVDVFIASHRAFGLRYPLEEVPVVGAKAAGVKAINLKEGDYVVSGALVPSEGDSPILLLSQRGAAKRMLAQELPQLGRAKRGLMIFRELKKNPHRLVYMTTDIEGTLILTTNKGIEKELEISKVAISDRISNGTFTIDEKQDGALFSAYHPQELTEE